MTAVPRVIRSVRAAMAALITGAAGSFFGYGVPAWFISYFNEEAAEALPGWMQGFDGSFVFSVLAALLAYLIVGLLTRKPAPAAA